jgi:hypothetical protein
MMIHHHNPTSQRKLAQGLMLLTCVLEVPSLNLGQDIEYHNSSFSGCTQSLQVNSRVVAQNRP